VIAMLATMPMKDFFGFPFLPIDASASGGIIDNMIIYVHYLMIPLFVGWGLYFIYVLFRFSAKKNPKANYAGVNGIASKYVEVGIILAEIVLLFGFSIPLWSVLANTFPAEKDSTIVAIVGEQFAWNFHYPGPDGRFGTRFPERVDVQTNPLGLDRTNDIFAKDDVVAKKLILPVDKPVIAHVTSKDVIHALGIPVMRVKQDAIPGMSIPVTFTPVKIGKYLIACSQLCGVGHSSMRGFVDIISLEEFDAWLAAEVIAAGLEAEEGDVW